MSEILPANHTVLLGKLLFAEEGRAPTRFYSEEGRLSFVAALREASIWKDRGRVPVGYCVSVSLLEETAEWTAHLFLHDPPLFPRLILHWRIREARTNMARLTWIDRLALLRAVVESRDKIPPNIHSLPIFPLADATD